MGVERKDFMGGGEDRVLQKTQFVTLTAGGWEMLGLRSQLGGKSTSKTGSAHPPRQQEMYKCFQRTDVSLIEEKQARISWPH